MSLMEFKANMTGGGARPNQFKVELTIPNIAQNASEAGRRAQFLCHAASLPESNIGVASVFYRGRELKLAGERTFQPWSVTILNDTDFMIRNSLESWSNRINDLTLNTGITNPLLYTTDMSVHQLDRNGGVLKSYKFVGAFPIDISAIQLGFNQNDQVEEFQATFAYMHYETDFSSAISVGITTPIGGLSI